MKHILLGLLLGALVVGCASFATNTFRAEQTAANTVFAAYVGYTNALANGTLKITADQSNAVKVARLKFAASVQTLETWRAAYQTNSSVEPQVQAALDAAQANASEILNLINFLKQ